MGMQQGSSMTGTDAIKALSGLGGLAVRSAGDGGKDSRDRARALTLAAEDEATAQRKQARQDADSLREQQRRSRSRSMIALGKSGVTLSGSPAAVLQGRQVEDEKEYRSLLASGLDRSDQTLSRARLQAAQSRSGSSNADWLQNGLGLAGSLISTGSLF